MKSTALLGVLAALFASFVACAGDDENDGGSEGGADGSGGAAGAPPADVACGDAMSYSIATSMSAWFHGMSTDAASGGPSVAASAVSYSTNARSDGIEMRVPMRRGFASATPFSRTST